MTQPTSPATARPPAKRPGKLPRSTSEPGSRKVEDSFFTRYPRFLDTSRTATSLARLDLRHHAIFQQNSDLFEGARVLDIASHDGRWSMAALDAGAAHVTGVEGRPELVDFANEHFRDLDVSPDRFRFVAGDIFEVLAREDIKVDVVLCLGFFYHTLRYSELFELIARCGPHHLIIDTEVALGKNFVIRIGKDGVDHPQNAIADRTARGGEVLTGRPTLKALRMLARAYGFPPEGLSDWAGLRRDNPDLRFPQDYGSGRRVTMRCRAAD